MTSSTPSSRKLFSNELEQRLDELLFASTSHRSAKGIADGQERLKREEQERVLHWVDVAAQSYAEVDYLIASLTPRALGRLDAAGFEAWVLAGLDAYDRLGGQAAMALLRDKVVLNIVTTYAWTGSPYVVPSATAKAGVLAMTRSLAVEWAKYGIRMNAIAPGPFPTKGAWDRLVPGDLQEKFDLKNRVPLKRVGEHQELANLAAYLVSDFSGYVNGDVITIDGGEWLNGAGEYSMFEAVSESQWDDIEKMVRGAKSE